MRMNDNKEMMIMYLYNQHKIMLGEINYFVNYMRNIYRASILRGNCLKEQRSPFNKIL